MEKLLIAQSSWEMAGALETLLAGRFQITVCTDGLEAAAYMERLRPENLILDLMLPGLDGLSVLDRCAGCLPKAVMVTTYRPGDYAFYSSAARSVDYVMPMPCAPTVVAARFLDVAAHAALRVQAAGPESGVSWHLTALGVPVQRDGYAQLCAAVPLYAQDPAQRLTKELYPAVARACGFGSGGQVERSIRSAIHAAWEQRDKRVWAAYFPGAARCPSNKEFISRLAEKTAIR